jgi:hypothetical protein
MRLSCCWASLLTRWVTSSRYLLKSPAERGNQRGLHLQGILTPCLASLAGVLKKLSLAGLAKLSRLRYSRLRFGLVWPQPAIVDSESTIGRCTKPAKSQLIPQSSMKYLGLA